jgi:RNA-binding protein
MELTGKQRRFLRALAHALDPLVRIGRSGLTDAVRAKLDEVLEIHELIKVKLGRECPLDVESAPLEVERATGAAVAQVIGRTLVVYRPRTEQPRIDLVHLRVRAESPKPAENKRPRT